MSGRFSRGRGGGDRGGFRGGRGELIDSAHTEPGAHLQGRKVRPLSQVELLRLRDLSLLCVAQEEDEGVARAEAGSTMALQRRSSKLEYANTRVRERLSAS